MKKALATAFTISVLSLSSPAFAQVTPPTPTTSPMLTATPPAGVTGQPQAGRHEHGEHHPEMHKAMRHLEEAKKNLESAAHDYSGHRDQAIQLINQAEQQIQMGLQDDHH